MYILHTGQVVFVQLEVTSTGAGSCTVEKANNNKIVRPLWGQKSISQGYRNFSHLAEQKHAAFIDNWHQQ